MTIQHNVRLADYTTMRLGGIATALAEVTSKEELLEALAWAQEQHMEHFVLGGGSNVIFQDDYNGLIILNKIPGFEIIEQDTNHTVIRIGAGENWDGVVKRTVDMNLHGIEMLSLIPGTAGATPVQNVGAYGGEISQTLLSLEAYDTQQQEFIELTNNDCKFNYRNSIFKDPKNRRYIITSITLDLHPGMPRPPFYESLQKYLDEHTIANYTPATIRDAVIAIRKTKLPDPSIIANTGSFFKNPIISKQAFNKIEQQHPGIPHYDMPDSTIKLLAGWLIDQAGLKGYRAHGMKVYDHNALVFINESATSYDELAAFRQEVVEKVEAAFGVTLEQEPELV